MSLDSSSSNSSHQLGNSFVKIFYRIHPADKLQFDTVKLRSNSRIYVKKTVHLKPDASDYWEFETDGVFNNSKQEEVFQKVVDRSLEKLEYGHNAVIVCFGKPGTGKSATLAGLEFTEENYGLAPRIIKELLRIKQAQKNRRICIKMSYAEFSKMTVYDLLKEYPHCVNDNMKLSQKLVRKKVRSQLEALKELYAAEGRKITKRVKNYMSHVNNSVLTFYVTTEDTEYNIHKQITGKIHLVDMAGSDCFGSISSMLKDKYEISEANLNKTYMEQFFLALCTRSKEMIKIKSRMNPFIYFLGDDLKGQSALRFIGHITTLKEDATLTVSMLKFGQIVRGFKPTIVNLEYEISPEHKLKYLQDKVIELQNERIQSSILLNQDMSICMNCDRIKHLKKTVKEYLQNQISEIEVMSVADASTVFRHFKDLVDQMENEIKLLKDASSKRDSDTSIPVKKTLKKKRSGTSVQTAVSEQVILLPEEDHLRQQIRQHTKMSEAKRESYSMSEFSIGKSKKNKSRSALARVSLRRRSFSGNVSNEQLADQYVVPDNVPENMEVWNDYVKNSQYTLIAEQYRENEKSVLDSYSEYINEMKLLQEYKHQTEAMKQELLEAKVLMEFKEKSGGVDEQTEQILNEADSICMRNMVKAEKSMLDQQEIVLRCLSEFKIYLNNRKELKKKLNEDYDSYCKTKLNMSLPAAKSFSDLDMIPEAQRIEIDDKCRDEPHANVDKEVLEHERKKQHTILTKVMLYEKKKIEREKYYNKPYRLVPLPVHRDAPTRYKPVAPDCP
ncbi:unnamed protein product [Phyllotreta striolata]|uniref:Kinesin motor domain-containing protein n=1 Tax=Phyllotreta striolata TaxID=444603 RepID=A0A9N9XSA6_PHYSR|nr:unnamed protein product [Phyllotreta striolata]